MTDLANAFAQLSAAGHSVQLLQWDPSSGVPAASEDKRLRIPICGANYVKPRPPIPPRPAQKPNVPSASSTTTTTTTTTDASFAINVQQNQRDTVISTESAIVRHSTPKSVTPSPPKQLEDIRPMMTTTEVQPDLRPIVSAARTLDSNTVETIRQTLAALQRMQHETTRLHQQFLEGQEAAFKTFERLAGTQLGIGLTDAIEGPVSPGTHLSAFLATPWAETDLEAKITPAVMPPVSNQFQEVSRPQPHRPAPVPDVVPA